MVFGLEFLPPAMQLPPTTVPTRKAFKGLRVSSAFTHMGTKSWAAPPSPYAWCIVPELPSPHKGHLASDHTGFLPQNSIPCSNSFRQATDPAPVLPPTRQPVLDAHKNQKTCMVCDPEADAGDNTEIQETAEISATHHPGMVGGRPRAVFICQALTTGQRHTGHLWAVGAR